MSDDKKRIPKWKAEWDRLVGDHQYFAIKNWDKYQALTSAGIPVAQWIKDFVEKDFEEGQLKGLERWLLDRLRRWRGRRGANIPADVAAIISATHAHHTDRAHIPHALCRLVTRGFLVPSNQRSQVLKKIQEEKNQQENQQQFPSGESSGQEGQDQNQPPDMFRCQKCSALVTAQRVDFNSRSLPYHLGCDGQVRFEEQQL